jgi:hypothetical protein
MSKPLTPYIEQDQWKKQRYLKQLKRIRNKQNPSCIMFDDVNLHNSVREILGDTLSLQMIKDVHDEIDRQRRQNACRDKLT